MWPDAATQREAVAHPSPALALSWRTGHGRQRGATPQALSPRDPLRRADLTARPRLAKGGPECPSRMMREYHVRFPGEGALATAPPYPASRTRGHDWFPGCVAHSAPAAAEPGRSARSGHILLGGDSSG